MGEQCPCCGGWGVCGIGCSANAERIAKRNRDREPEWTTAQWDNLHHLSYQLHDLLTHREAPGGMTQIERVQLRLVLDSIAGFSDDKIKAYRS